MARYLFYSATIGTGVDPANAFVPAISEYGPTYAANDGRVDPTNPDPDVYSMLVEAELDTVGLIQAQNDPRMEEVIPGQTVPALNTVMSSVMSPSHLSSLQGKIEDRAMDATGVIGALTFREFFKLLLLEFKFRSFLRDDYFKVAIDAVIHVADVFKILTRLENLGFNVGFIPSNPTPRDIFNYVYVQRADNADLARLFHTHLDLPL